MFHYRQVPLLGQFLSVATQLEHRVSKSIEQLVTTETIKESTAQNIIHDLVMFGVATGTPQELFLDDRVESSSDEHVLLRMRDVLRRHALTRRLMKKFDRGETIRQEDMIETLKTINRAAQHRARTWSLYADRMGRWLLSTGLAVTAPGGWQLQDRGEVRLPSARRRGRGTFIGDAPPHRTVEALIWLQNEEHVSRSAVTEAKFRNAFTVLSRFGLVDAPTEGGGYVPSGFAIEVNPLEAVWKAANEDETLKLVVEYLNVHPSASGASVAAYVNEASQGKWSDATKLRVGNGLRRWAEWLMQSYGNGTIPDLPKDETRKPGKKQTQEGNPTLFD